MKKTRKSSNKSGEPKDKEKRCGKDRALTRLHYGLKNPPVFHWKPFTAGMIKDTRFHVLSFVRSSFKTSRHSNITVGMLTLSAPGPMLRAPRTSCCLSHTSKLYKQCTRRLLVCMAAPSVCFQPTVEQLRGFLRLLVQRVWDISPAYSPMHRFFLRPA